MNPLIAVCQKGNAIQPRCSIFLTRSLSINFFFLKMIKKLEIDQMVAMQGGLSRGEIACGAGMAASAFFLNFAVAAVTGGVGELVFAVGWSIASSYLCDQAG